MGENCEGDFTSDPRVIFPFTKPLKASAGFLNLKGTLFDSAIMKTSVISPAFTEQYLSNPDDPMAFEGPVAVFDGPEDYHHRIETDKSITAGTILIIRGAGPVGYPGAAEVVNMIPPGHLIKQGIEVRSSSFLVTTSADKTATMHRRRSTIRNIRFSINPKRFSRSSNRWNARIPQERRYHSN